MRPPGCDPQIKAALGVQVEPGAAIAAAAPLLPVPPGR